MLRERHQNLRALKRRVVLGLLGSTIALGLQATDVQAQMRTGRGTRTMYTQPNNGSSAQAEEEQEVSSEVQQASYRQPTQKSAVRRASASQRTVQPAQHVNHSHGSGVVQASCPDCEAHGEVVGEPMAFPDYQGVGGCDSCGSCDPCGCGPDYLPSAFGGYGVCHPNGVFGSLLNNLHFRIEGAAFWQTPSDLPALVTSGPQSVAQTLVGQVGRTDTVYLLGNDPSDTNPVKTNRESSNGFRGSIGSWFDPMRTRGILFRAYDTGTWDTEFTTNQTINPVITRPFFDVSTNAQSTVVVAYPNSATGNVAASITSASSGGDILLRRNWIQSHGNRWDFLWGYQTAQLEDGLLVNSTTTANNGTSLNIIDQFTTQNQFDGLALGLNSFSRVENWSLDSMIKLGFGSMDREVTIDGFQRRTVSANNFTEQDQGLLARATNSGTTNSNTFVVVPELNLTLGYRLTYRLDLTIGYSMLALPKVARASDQIDPSLRVNLTNPLVGDVAPNRNFAESTYLLQSFNYGLQWRY